MIKPVFFFFLFLPLLVQADVTAAAKALEQAKLQFFFGELAGAKTAFMALESEEGAEAHYYLALIEKMAPSAEDTGERVFQHLSRSAELGHSVAMWDVGVAYENGEGVAQDPLKAMDWYRQSEQAAGAPKAVTHVVESDGELVEQPLSQVAIALQLQAEQGDAAAQYQLGKSFDAGYLGEQNLDAAFYWYSKAATGGHSYAQYVVAYLYCRGIGVAPDAQAANLWLKESGRAGRCQ